MSALSYRTQLYRLSSSRPCYCVTLRIGLPVFDWDFDSADDIGLRPDVRRERII